MAHYAYKAACYDIDRIKYQELVNQFEEEEGRDHDGDSNYDGDNWYIMAMWINELRAKVAELESQASSASVPGGWKPITDVQWMNIVNLNHAWENHEKDDAINEVVKLTEARCKANNPNGVSVLASLQSMCEESLAPDVYEMWLQVKAALITTRKSLAAAPTPPVSEDRKDAERYRWFRSKVSAATRKTFHFGGIIRPLSDLWRGSVAQHLDEAIDAAMQEDKP